MQGKLASYTEQCYGTVVNHWIENVTFALRNLLYIEIFFQTKDDKNDKFRAIA